MGKRLSRVTQAEFDRAMAFLQAMSDKGIFYALEVLPDGTIRLEPASDPRVTVVSKRERPLM